MPAMPEQLTSMVWTRRPGISRSSSGPAGGRPSALRWQGTWWPDRGVEAAEVGLEAAVLVQVPQEGRAFDGLRRHQAGVGIVEQVEGVLAQHEGGGRFGAEDGPALAGQVGQEAQVVLQRLRGPSPRRRRPAAPCRSRSGRAARRPRRRCDAARPSPPRRWADRYSWRTRRRSRRRAAGRSAAGASSRDAGRGGGSCAGRRPAAGAGSTRRTVFPAASGRRGWTEHGVGHRGEGAADAGKQLGARHGPVGAVQAVARRCWRPWPPASAGGR